MNLINKLIKMGVGFPDGVPTCWHYFNKGQLPRILLCYEIIIGRNKIKLDSNIKWKYANDSGYFIEAIFPISILTKNEILLQINLNPEYGTKVLEVVLKGDR